MKLLAVDPISSTLVAAAALVEAGARAYVEGSELVERVPLDGDDWRDRYNAALGDVAGPWRRGQQALTDARATVAALGSTDERVRAATARLDEGWRTVQRGYSYISSVLSSLPQPLEPQFASMALGRMGGAGRTIAASLADAAAALRQLTAPAYQSATR